MEVRTGVLVRKNGPYGADATRANIKTIFGPTRFVRAQQEAMRRALHTRRSRGGTGCRDSSGYCSRAA
nr:MAG: hypothetical protein DIU78_06715 [Pseudomonadota bacterium]